LDADATVGSIVSINSAAVVEHDVVLEDHCHVGPGAVLCVGVIVEKGAFVGAGATVRQEVLIGAWSTVGAGSVVVRDVPRAARVAGVPARFMETPAKAKAGKDSLRGK
jgi:acetyltransferase-like isoleucine patch superfamily enzyme